MRFQTTTRPLRELVREFHVGGILLPQFQRDYVWRAAKIRNLLDSLLHGYPIGGFYLWRPEGGMLDVKPKQLGDQVISPVFEGYLIDGQQRLTSLEAAFGLYAGEDKGGAELRCFLDLAASSSERARDTKLFVSYGGNKGVARRVDAGDSTLVPVALLFHGQNFDLRGKTEEALRSLAGWDGKRLQAAMRRFDQASTMLDQQVPCTTITDVTDSEAVEVFSRLNKGGSPLRQGDVRAAELARGKAVDVLKRMRIFVAGERLRRLGFGFSFAFRGLVLFHRGTAQFGSLRPDWLEAPGPHGRTLSQSWKAAERAIDAALEFVDIRMGWGHRALLPSANAVIILAAALDQMGLEADPAAEQKLRRWLCLTALRGVFQGSVETKMNRFYRAVRDSGKDVPKALLDALKRDESRRVRSDEFYSYSQPWSAPTQVIHAWLVGRSGKDWLTGESLDALGRSGSISTPDGNLTVHHIFPRKVLAGFEDSSEEANCPANYALLSKSSNSEIGDRPPDEVWATLTPEQRQRAATQFFSDAAGDRLRPDRYDEFCEWRAGRLAEAINDWLGID